MPWKTVAHCSVLVQFSPDLMVIFVISKGKRVGRTMALWCYFSVLTILKCIKQVSMGIVQDLGGRIIINPPIGTRINNQ